MTHIPRGCTTCCESPSILWDAMWDQLWVPLKDTKMIKEEVIDRWRGCPASASGRHGLELPGRGLQLTQGAQDARP